MNETICSGDCWNGQLVVVVLSALFVCAVVVTMRFR